MPTDKVGSGSWPAAIARACDARTLASLTLSAGAAFAARSSAASKVSGSAPAAQGSAVAKAGARNNIRMQLSSGLHVRGRLRRTAFGESGAGEARELHRRHVPGRRVLSLSARQLLNLPAAIRSCHSHAAAGSPGFWVAPVGYPFRVNHLEGRPQVDASRARIDVDPSVRWAEATGSAKPT